MRKYLFLSIVSLFWSAIHGAPLTSEQNSLKITKPLLDNIKIEKGSILIIEQNLAKIKDYSKDEPFFVSFFCLKGDCKVSEIKTTIK